MKLGRHLHAGVSHWEAAYESLAYTVEALGAAAGDPELAKLRARLPAQLADWEGIERDRRRLRRVVIAATASAHVADALLDVALGAFATDLLGVVAGDPSSGMYTRFFTIPHEEVIAMGLDSELPMVTLILDILDRGTDVPDILGHHRAPLRAALQLGHQALAARSDALADTGRHSGRMESWLDGTETTLVNLRHALARLAAQRYAPGTWAEAFFG